MLLRCRGIFLADQMLHDHALCKHRCLPWSGQTFFSSTVWAMLRSAACKLFFLLCLLSLWGHTIRTLLICIQPAFELCLTASLLNASHSCCRQTVHLTCVAGLKPCCVDSVRTPNGMWPQGNMVMLPVRKRASCFVHRSVINLNFKGPGNPLSLGSHETETFSGSLHRKYGALFSFQQLGSCMKNCIRHLDAP